MRSDWDVIVVGAGLAGLTAGATAAAGGAATVVLDAAQPGGRARTVAKGPYVFNMGAHALYVGGPGARILRSLGVEPDGAPSPFPRYKLLKDGELHLMPSGPASVMRTTALGAASKAQFARLMGMLPMLRPAKLAAMSIDQWIADHSLRPEVEAVVRALIRLSTYTSETSEFSADAVIRQLQIGARPGVVYLHGGWAQLIEGLARHVQVEARSKVTGIEASAHDVLVHTTERTLRARQVVLAPGTPTATRALLADDPGWDGLGRPVTAACLDLGTTRVPTPGYVLSADEPLLGVTQSPPARQSPDGRAVVQAIRYGATEADADRLSLDGHVARLGVKGADIETSRFLARMIVAAATPRPDSGGLRGRPRVTDSGHARVFIAGDWVGPEGWLADASIASGHEAARSAITNLDTSPVLVA